jgi:hypothetical protein
VGVLPFFVHTFPWGEPSLFLIFPAVLDFSFSNQFSDRY